MSACCWAHAKNNAEQVELTNPKTVYSVVHLLQSGGPSDEESTSYPRYTLCGVRFRNLQPERDTMKCNQYKKWEYSHHASKATCGACVHQKKTGVVAF